MLKYAFASIALLSLFASRQALAQPFPVCIPGTPVCARANGNGGVQILGGAQAQVGTNGVNATAHGAASSTGNAQANGAANATGAAQANGAANATGAAQAQGSGTATGAAHGDAGGRSSAGGSGSIDGGERGSRSYGGYSQPTLYYSQPIRFGAGVTFCGTLKAGVFSGIKAGPCFAVSFRTERLTFEMETQLLIGGVRHSIDWVFPMSFVIPLTEQRSLYEGLQLRLGGSPIGVTFAKAANGGNYLRFGLHAGLSYEYDLGPAASWRVFDARAFLDFGTKRQVDNRDNFLDFGAQLSTGIVF